MKSFVERHKQVWNKEFSLLVCTGAALFLVSLVMNFLATMYATQSASMPVTDLILSNMRAFDVDWIIIYGPLLLILYAGGATLYHPKRIPFVLKSVALFIIIRAVFISLTHIGPFSPQELIVPSRILNILGMGTSADLFFSGHTGQPFLLALIYWDDIRLRLIFLATSIIFAASVLLGHIHYSIDVFGAFFITYTIFHIAIYLFSKDWKLAQS